MKSQYQFTINDEASKSRISGDLILEKTDAHRHFLLHSIFRFADDKELIRTVKKMPTISFKGADLDMNAFDLISEDAMSPYCIVTKTFPKTVSVDDIIGWLKLNCDAFQPKALVLRMIQTEPDIFPVSEGPRLRAAMPLPKELSPIILATSPRRKKGAVCVSHAHASGKIPLIIR